MDTYILEYYMDTDSCIVYIKTEDTCVGISKDVKTRFDTSNYEFVRPLPNDKKQKSYWFHERSIRWENDFGVCYIKTKNIQLFSRL